MVKTIFPTEALATRARVRPPAHHRAVHDVVPEPLASGVAAPFRQVINSGEPLLDIEMTGPTATTVGKDHRWLTNDYPLTAPEGQCHRTGHHRAQGGGGGPSAGV